MYLITSHLLHRTRTSYNRNRKSNSWKMCELFGNKFNLKDKEKNIIQYKLESILGGW